MVGTKAHRIDCPRNAFISLQQEEENKEKSKAQVFDHVKPAFDLPTMIFPLDRK
jgi:hypothetical protein